MAVNETLIGSIAALAGATIVGLVSTMYDSVSRGKKLWGEVSKRNDTSSRLGTDEIRDITNGCGDIDG